jgi:hypothetical protein
MTGRKLQQREVFEAIYSAGTIDADLAFQFTCSVFAECGGYEHARLVYTDSAGNPREPYEADEGPFQLATRYLPRDTPAADVYTLEPAAELARAKLLAAREAGREPLAPWYGWSSGNWKRWAPRGAQGVGNALLVRHGMPGVLSRPLVRRAGDVFGSPPVRLRDHDPIVGEGVN